ncbi:hypothetical protein M0805_007337 [Coniferiporia weirii]|nr:hypothetical protein M0805_007337 [Coniferiporia weirii]
MFSTSGLFSTVPCPDKSLCKRTQCIFSHAPNTKQPVIPQIPVSAPVAGPSTLSSSTAPAAGQSTSSRPHVVARIVPTKRPGVPFAKSYAAIPDGLQSREPPRKLQKLDHTSARVEATTSTTATTTATGVPVLRVNAAKSQVAIPVRQAMLKTLYETFANLYSNILVNNPSLASEHALLQEQEVYEKSTKLTYRNAVISSVAALKRRSKPTAISDAAVGTEETLQKRRDEHDKLRALQLSSKHLSPLIMSMDALQQWGFMTAVPDGEGGVNPSDEGKIKQCERCSGQFVVRRREEADECTFHWGRAQMTRMNGEKVRVWSCCLQPSADSEGCGRGPHVFKESLPEELHSRHAFSFTRSVDESFNSTDTALDVVCLDCEMVYTTGGIRVARVSVVDGSGKEIFDELVKMDDTVEVIDFNTRFSGITEDEYKKAVLPLKSIRRALDSFINSNTIIVGHALDNDLKTLRMIHCRCVDTVVLFPHRAGPPYRRALRELSRELLGRAIQVGGGTSGHSSVEDSIATLDLVRWFVLNGSQKKPILSTA